VLQHGSLLLAPNPDVGGAARHRGLADFSEAARLGDDGWPVWTDAWLERLAAALGESVDSQIIPFIETAPSGLAAGRERFASNRWTCRR
jgi:hypothetical protein